jgi:hypothetical protein
MPRGGDKGVADDKPIPAGDSFRARKAEDAADDFEEVTENANGTVTVKKRKRIATGDDEPDAINKYVAAGGKRDQAVVDNNVVLFLDPNADPSKPQGKTRPRNFKDPDKSPDSR